MVNLRQQRLLLSFVVAFRRCHPSGMLMRLARMLVLLAQTAAVAAAKALFETQAGLKSLVPPAACCQ